VARYDAGPVLRCAAAPLPGCKTGVSARLRLIERDDDAKDQLQWKLSKGSATSASEIGDPITTDDYVVCAFDESTPSPELLIEAAVPAAGQCGKTDCWKRTPSGVKYKDDDGTPLGVTRVGARSGDRSTVKVQGRGANLQMPALPLTLPVRVQLQTETGACWEAVFSAAGARKNLSSEFAGRSD
jgi:hypothetical protein